MNKFYLYYLLMSMFFYSCANESESNKKVSVDLKQSSSNVMVVDSGPIKIEITPIQDVNQENAPDSNKEAKEEKSNTESKTTPKTSISRPASKSKSSAIISFEQNNFDFGRIVQGEKILHDFVFQNKGDAPLVIKDAKASCGCTKPIYPFIPIEPGEKGTILVQFNSNGRLGRQTPSINVVSNASNKIISLHLTGEVVTEEFRDTIK